MKRINRNYSEEYLLARAKFSASNHCKLGNVSFSKHSFENFFNERNLAYNSKVASKSTKSLRVKFVRFR